MHIERRNLTTLKQDYIHKGPLRYAFVMHPKGERDVNYPRFRNN